MIPRYGCRLCYFEDNDLNVVIEHLMKNHIEYVKEKLVRDMSWTE